MKSEDERLTEAIRSAVLTIAVPDTTSIDVTSAIEARRTHRRRVPALLVAAVLAIALAGVVVIPRLDGSNADRTAASAPSLTPSASGGASSQSAPTDDWENWVVPSTAPSTDIPLATLEAGEQVNAIFRGYEDHWAGAYVDDDLRTVVVNVKTGHEQAVAEQIAQVRAIASAPVRIRLVEHSSNELMARAEPLDAFTYFAGSRYTSARVDQKLNSLVVGIDKVTPEAVRAVQDATGEGTYVEQNDVVTASLP